jgi:PAS domain S-box-containing protein
MSRVVSPERGPAVSPSGRPRAADGVGFGWAKSIYTGVVMCDSMAFEATVVSLSLMAAALLAALAAYFVRVRRPDRGARPLVALLAVAAFWAASVVAGDVAVAPSAVDWWARLALPTLAVAVLAWFVYVLEYTGRSELVTDGLVAALAVAPAGVALLAWTNELHGLVWTTAGGGATSADGFGVVYWVYAVVVGLQLVAGAGMLGLMVVRSDDLYREQTAALLVAALAPLVTVLVDLGDPQPVATLGDPGRVGPVGVAVGGVALTYAALRFEMTNLTPVAHNTVVENIRDGVFVLDRNDRVTDINEVAETILGVEGDGTGRHAEQVLSVYPGLYERYRDVDRIQEEIGLDDGDERRFFHIQISPLYDSRDRRMGRLFLIHDITDQKRRQQELERQNERLDQFASLVSHDLRNPLNVAEGYVDIVEETGDTSYLEKIDDSLDRMGQLIDDVLTLAREGQTIEETEGVDLREVASEAWGNVDTAEAVLEVRSVARFEASPDRLLRVFENLFRNAIEHGREDVRIRVGALDGSVGLSPEGRGFYVEDDGPGIPAEERDQVLEDGYTTSDDGTGLGLSIVSEIVEAHGWDIRVTESRDGGARFEVTGVEPGDNEDWVTSDTDPDPGTPGRERPARADGGD